MNSTDEAPSGNFELPIKIRFYTKLLEKGDIFDVSPF